MEEEITVPPVLKVGTRGVRVKIWTFLNLNKPKTFTAKEITKHLEMPLSTVQLALKDLDIFSPRIKSKDKKRIGKGRPQREYWFQQLI